MQAMTWGWLAAHLKQSTGVTRFFLIITPVLSRPGKNWLVPQVWRRETLKKSRSHEQLFSPWAFSKCQQSEEEVYYHYSTAHHYTLSSFFFPLWLLLVLLPFPKFLPFGCPQAPFFALVTICFHSLLSPSVLWLDMPLGNAGVCKGEAARHPELSNGSFKQREFERIQIEKQGKCGRMLRTIEWN